VSIVDSPFDVLRIDPDADEEEIRQAYRERAKGTHPDRGGSAEEFLLVRTAYEEIKAGYGSENRDRNGHNADADTDANGDAGGASSDETTATTGTETEAGTEDEDDNTEAVTSRVEYLDYEVLDDHGWDLGDEDLFAKAASADLDPMDYGRFLVRPGESLLEAAENRGFAWPYACRGGACANCAIAVVEGDLEMPVNNILPSSMVDAGIRLSCNGIPTTDEMKVIYNVKHLPGLDELRLPPRPFEQAYAGD
jgi:curved DNA-binding protein CbpA